MAPKAAKKAGGKTRVKVAKKVKRNAPAYTTTRRSLKAGTIAIMLAGRFRGKRVTVLKQLPKNGPLVVTGPFKYNGVPLRRVNSRYVIATQTSVDLAGVDTSKVTAETFKRAAKAKKAKGEKEFMTSAKKRAAETAARKTAKASKARGANAGKVSADRLALQKSIDTAVIAAVKKDKLGKEKAGYLRSVFTVKPGDCPHRMAF
jgi:large subunit ribosomal protein L6e